MIKTVSLKFLKLLCNPYVMITVFMCVWLIFFDKNNWLTTYQTIQAIDKMEPRILHYRMEAEKNREQYHYILTDDYELEKYAREMFLMKKPNEDIYILEEN